MADMTLEEALAAATVDEELVTPVNEVLMINPETRIINVPDSEKLFGARQDMNAERKYFKCPRIVGDNIDLSEHRIFINYVPSKQDGTYDLKEDVQGYWCKDLAVEGDFVTFSWKLSENVTRNAGYIAFAVYAKVSDENGNLKTKWHTTIAIGKVLDTLPDGEELVTVYPDIVMQLLERMDALEQGGGSGGTPNAVQYVAQTLTQEQQTQARSNIGAASTNEVGKLSEEKVDKTGIKLDTHTDGLIYLFIDGKPVGIGLNLSGGGIVEPDNTLYNLPVLRLIGDTTGMTKEQEVIMTGEFVDIHGEPLFSDKVVEVKWQGSSSIWYDKKNYSIKLFESDGETKFKYKAFDDVDANNSYHLKANFIDAWHCRNIVTVNLAKDLYKKALPSNARGCIDGFPIIVEINGEKQGIYTWNLKQHKSVYGLDEDNPNHLMYRANTNGTDTCNFRALSANNMADSTTDWEDRFPETNTAENRAKLNRLISFVKDSDDATFKADFRQYLDLDYTIDYWILCYFGGFTDSVSKNMNIVTFDGNVWYPTFYDCDTTWGINWSGSEQTPYNVQCPSEYQAPNNLLWERLVANFPQEIYNRYYELRDTYLNVDEVIRRMQEFIDSIPEEEYEYDRSKWTLPTASVNSGIDYMTAWIKNRATYVDGKMNELVVTTIPLEGISITSTLKVTSGETAQLEVTYTPTNATNRNVTWKSSNDEIATVDENGLVTAISDGDCVITCTSEDGGFTAQCYLTINAPSIATDGLVYDFEFRNTEYDANGYFYSSVNGFSWKDSDQYREPSNVSEKGYLLKVTNALEISSIKDYVDIDSNGLTLEAAYYDNLPDEMFRIGNNTKITKDMHVDLHLFDADNQKISIGGNATNVVNKEHVVVPFTDVIDEDNMIHLVWRFYPDGTNEIFVNGCKSTYAQDKTNFDHYESNLMDYPIRIRNPYVENVIVASIRAYNRPLTDAEIANNFYAEKKK